MKTIKTEKEKINLEVKKEGKIIDSVKHLDIYSSTSKRCPICKKNLLSAIFYNVEIDYCPICLGLWFDEDELRWAKDEKYKELKWFDVDLWKDEAKFKTSYGIRLCPCCRMPLYEVYYGDSGIIVDVCKLCHGIWLDRMEFKKIVVWLHVKADYEIMNNYTKNMFKELGEVFNGPETLKEEAEDFMVILRMLGYRFSILHPVIYRLLSDAPRRY